MNVNDTLENLYKPMDDYVFSYIIPSIFITTMLFIIFNMYLKAEILESKLDWAKNKCIPKYMFVSGFIHNEPGENAISSTYNNFAHCVRQFKEIKKYIYPISMIEKTPANIKIIDNYTKIRKARGFETDVGDGTTLDYMVLYIKEFIELSKMTTTDFDNATSIDIKTIMAGLGIK